MRPSVVVFTGLTLLVSTGVLADSIRCGTQVIDEDSHQREVLKHCGEPTERRASSWYYDRGSDQFGVTIHFNPDGEVDRITDDAIGPE